MPAPCLSRVIGIEKCCIRMIARDSSFGAIYTTFHPLTAGIKYFNTRNREVSTTETLGAQALTYTSGVVYVCFGSVKSINTNAAPKSLQDNIECKVPIMRQIMGDTNPTLSLRIPVHLLYIVGREVQCNIFDRCIHHACLLCYVCNTRVVIHTM